MTSTWPHVELGRVLTHRKEFIAIDDRATYTRPRVRLHAQGIVQRDRLVGADIKTKKQQVCRSGEFLVAEIDAKVGGFGMVPDELDGSIVSSHYFLFQIDHSRLDRRFLDFYTRTRDFREQVEAQGSTNYAAIRPADVLAYLVPLPTLSEQRHIVTRIEGIAGKVEEARRMADAVVQELSQLLAAVRTSLSERAPRYRLGDIAPLVRRPVAVDIREIYQQVAVRSFGRGTFHKVPLAGADVTWEKPFRVAKDDILISNIKAWEGAIAVATPDDDGRVASHRYLTLVPKGNVATAKFLVAYLLSPEGLFHIGAASPGSADRNRTLSAKKLMEIEVPVPSYAEQKQFDSFVDYVARVRTERNAAMALYDGLMPTVLNRAFKGEI